MENIEIFNKQFTKNFDEIDIDEHPKSNIKLCLSPHFI